MLRSVGQGHSDLEYKKLVLPITRERLGLSSSNMTWMLVVTRRRSLLIFRSVGQVKVTVTFIITLGSTVLKLDVEVGGDWFKTPFRSKV